MTESVTVTALATASESGIVIWSGSASVFVTESPCPS